MLELINIYSGYGKVVVLKDISLSIRKGELVTVIGPNGAGKTTLIRTIAGVIKPFSGKIIFNGQDITDLPPYKRAKLRISTIPEGRGIFPHITVMENLKLGAYNNRDSFEEKLREIFEIFPQLKDRSNNLAKTLSGGERQMLAIARALMSNPELLMLDEPSLGLAPKAVENVYEVIDSLREQNITILLVEQNIELSLKRSDKAYVLENGKIVTQGSGEELLQHTDVKKYYFGLD